MTNPGKRKDKLYGDLELLRNSVAKEDKFLVLCDFSARVGTVHQKGLSEGTESETATAMDTCF